MNSYELNHSSHFDYANVVKRMKMANEKRSRPAPSKPASARATSLGGRPRPAPRPSMWSRMKSVLLDESKHMIVASLILLGFVVWLGSTAQTIYAQHTEAGFASACQQNQFAHAGSTYCYDDRRIVHTLKPDGTTTRPGLDWRVNESALRISEAAAAREAREAREAHPNEP
ncbi:hypothetical protein CCR94_16850 [Rhodoblastus sphagnicola]|uniref:Uncharacterized protein n=1 Tax=Rhodoblastus sphagnicola TaxID=333368 RepID=A0A2S6N2D7_9HYPH|nr:hypothetical protein [Rhodoblastus sphagnicola]MBB4197342.1 hypothetical protein [Rhodoblastus sphagnicola]PPQ28756.1 hypothetical protein CCR94_16850 [Rhodoblastus sphagnicola]